MTFEHFQTFHIWLLSFGSFAAKHWSFDTASLARGLTDLNREGVSTPFKAR
jgi:hypothetical protein